MSDAWADGLIGGLERENPAAARLAHLASLAVRVDAPLLRRLRHRFLQDADPGTEADLWFSPLMSSQDTSGCVLHDAVALRLRERLAAQSDEIIEEAVEVMREAHSHLPASVRLEEELTVLALRNAPDTDQEIERALQPALRSLSGNDEAAALEVARWAMHALRRMPARVRSASGAQILVLGAALRLETPGMAAGMADAAIGVETLSWVLPEQARGERMRLGVALYPNGIRFLQAEGAALSIELPKVQPAFVSVRWRSNSSEHRRLVAAAPNLFVDTGSGAEAVQIVTLAGDAYSLTVSVIEEVQGTAFGNSSALAQSANLEADVRKGCVLVRPLDSNGPPTIASSVGDGLWITAPPNKTRMGTLANSVFDVVGGSQDDQFEVLNAKDERAAVAILLPRLPKAEQILQQTQQNNPGVSAGYIIGFDGAVPRTFNAHIDGSASVLTVDEDVSSSVILSGAPILVEERLVGIIVAQAQQPSRQPILPRPSWRFANLLELNRAISAVAAERAEAATTPGKTFEKILLVYSPPDYRLALEVAKSLTAHGVSTSSLEALDTSTDGVEYWIRRVISADQAVLAIATPTVFDRWLHHFRTEKSLGQRPILLAVTERDAAADLPSRISTFVIRRNGTNTAELAQWARQQLVGRKVRDGALADEEHSASVEQGASSACVRIGSWAGDGLTGFAVDSGFVVSYAHPSFSLAQVGDRYEMVASTEAKRNELLILRPRQGAMPEPSLSLLSRDNPAIAGIFAGRDITAVVIAYVGEEFRPLRGRARWNGRRDRIEVSIPDDDVLGQREPVVFRGKFAGAPILVNGKALGLAVQHNYARDEPVLIALPAWKIREALDRARAPSDEQRRVFISYSREDSALALRIAAALRARGLLAHQGSADFDWIKASNLVVALVTRSALAGKYAREDWNFARNNGKRVLMAVMSPLTVEELPRDLRDIAAVRLEEDGGNFDDLVEQAVRAATDDAPVPQSDRETVKWAQQQLSHAGYSAGTEDGLIGPQTQEALIDFQRSRKLATNGRLTPETIAALDSVPARRQRTPDRVERPRRTPIRDAGSADRPKRSAKRAKAKKKKVRHKK